MRADGEDDYIPVRLPWLGSGMRHSPVPVTPKASSIVRLPYLDTKLDLGSNNAFEEYRSEKDALRRHIEWHIAIQDVHSNDRLPGIPGYSTRLSRRIQLPQSCGTDNVSRAVN